MDGDSGDEGNDELTCERSDKSDKSSWSAGRQSSLGSWFQRQGDVWCKERLLIFREELGDIWRMCATIGPLNRHKIGWLRSTVGGTPVFGRRTDTVLRSTFRGRVTTCG